MSAALILDPVPKNTCFWVRQDGQCVGVLYPPKTPDDVWEYWDRHKLIVPDRFASKAEAMAFLDAEEPLPVTYSPWSYEAGFYSGASA